MKSTFCQLKTMAREMNNADDADRVTSKESSSSSFLNLAKTPTKTPPERKKSGVAFEKAQAAVEKATKNAAKKTEKFLKS